MTQAAGGLATATGIDGKYTTGMASERHPSWRIEPSWVEERFLI